jgi:hypothetical protein
MQAVSLTAAAGKAGLRDWIGLAVLALPTPLISIDVPVGSLLGVIGAASARGPCR